MTKYWIIRSLLLGLSVAVAAIIGHYFHFSLEAALIVAIFMAIFWTRRDIQQVTELVNWMKQEANSSYLPLSGHGYLVELQGYLQHLLWRKEKENQQHSLQLQRLFSAIQVSPDGLILLNEHAEIELCNAIGATHLGLDQQRDLHQHITHLVRVPEFVRYLEKRQFDQPLILPHRDGEGKLLIQIYPYGEGQSLLLSRDITQTERVEKMRRQFVAHVSHEIRTPLTILAGFIETQLHCQLDETERQASLVLMQQQAERMSALVTDLLTLARLEDGSLPPADQWHDVQQMLNQTANMAKAFSKGYHQLHFEIQANAKIAGIESEIVSALSNLVVNAIRYSPEKGVIHVVWQCLAQGGGVFHVTDSGHGIAEHHLAHLTERFYRVDKSRSRETGGTGLGLSIVKQIMIRHGGRLTIESKEGKGSTFSLYFPAMRVQFIPVTSVEHIE